MISISRYDHNYILARTQDFTDEYIIKKGTHEWSNSERGWLVPRQLIVDIVEQSKKEELRSPCKPYSTEKNIILGSYPEDIYQLEKTTTIAFEANLAALRAIRQTGCRMEDIDYFRDNFCGRFEPKRHQLVTYQFIDVIEKCAIYNDMGTGKTACVIWNIDTRLKRKQIYSALVVAPNNVLQNWKEEVSIHAPRLKVAILHGTRDERLDKLESMAHIYLINYEGLRVIGDELKHRFQMVVLDEAHKIKDPGATQTKLCFKLFNDIKYMVAMTGTPIGNNLIDLHQIMTWLDPYMFEPFYIFRAAYFYNIGYRWLPKSETPKMMQEKIYRRAVRYRKDECLDLPEKTYIQRTCVLSEMQAIAYRQMLKAMMTLMEEGLITAKNVLSQIVKLSEITSGFIRDENGYDHIFAKCAKMDLLSSIIDEIGEDKKVVIWARYINDIKRIGKELGPKKSLLLYGATAKGNKAFDLVEEFRCNKEKSYMIANPAVGGLGLNMTVANYAIYYSNDYSWIKRSQSEDRIHRMGSEQHENITIIDLISELTPGKPTIDKTVVTALVSKKDLSYNIIDLFKSEIIGSFGIIQERINAEGQLASATKNIADLQALINFSLPQFQGAFSIEEPACPDCHSKSVNHNAGGMICADCGSVWE